MPAGTKVSQGMHLHQRRELTGVAKIVGVGASRQRWARLGLGGDDADRFPRQLWRTNGKLIPAKLEPPPTQPMTTSG